MIANVYRGEDLKATIEYKNGEVISVKGDIVKTVREVLGKSYVTLNGSLDEGLYNTSIGEIEADSNNRIEKVTPKQQIKNRAENPVISLGLAEYKRNSGLLPFIPFLPFPDASRTSLSVISVAKKRSSSELSTVPS